MKFPFGTYFALAYTAANKSVFHLMDRADIRGRFEAKGPQVQTDKSRRW